ncbi:MAG: T9SS type A sorting domain-containing protein [Bacteroidia bacterium]|nr:T9SS type A sorting domain-containing protein [Bacteroidia bacterium]
MNKFTYVTVLLLLTCFNISAQITTQELTQLQKAENFLDNKEEIYFSFKVNDKEEIKSYTQEFSIVNYHPRTKTLVAWANRQQFEAFLDKGIPFKVDGLENEPVERLMSNQLNIDSVENNFRATPLTFPLTAYPTYQDYADQMALFATNNSSICQLVDIGGTTEGAGGGNKRLLFIKLSDNVSVQEQEPRVMYTSSMHGDEIAGYPLMLNLINYFITAYNNTGHADHTRVKNLIDNSEVWINPSANPDGTYYNSASNTSVANARRANDNNIDLNRNYPDNIIGPHANGHSAYELETQHFMSFADTYKFVLSANFHGGTEVVNYAWDNTSTRHADDAWLFDVSKEYAVNCQNDAFSYNGDTNYMDAEYTNFVWPGVTNGNDWYEVYGGRQDYMNYYKLCKETTLELTNIKTPPASELVNLWNWNREALIDYLVQGLYGFTGVVKDASTNNPIEATITLVGHDSSNSHTTSESTFGDYYRPVKAGTYDILFEAPCYQSFTLTNQTIADYETKLLSTVLLTPGTSIPSSVTPSSVASATATVSWNNQTDNTFDLRYRQTGTSTWTDVTDLSTNTHNVTGLTASTEYEVQVRSKCDSFTSNYSSSIIFTTTAVDYCSSSATNQNRGYISNVSLESINNNSGTSGYTDYTSLSTNLGQSSTYSFSLTNGTGSTYACGIAVWIDFNQDGDFLDTNENVISQASSSTATKTGNITIPATATPGNTRMRVSLKRGGTPTSCETMVRGEVEDYSINIIPPPAASDPPTAACQDITVVLDAAGSVTIDPLDIDNGSTDDVGITSYSLDNTSFSCSDIGDNTVILTVEDADGQMDTCSATVTIQNKAPVPTVADLPELTDECSVTPTVPTATDCSLGTILGLPDVTSFNTQGTHTITWQYFNVNGMVSQEQTVIIDDVTAPVPDLGSLPDLDIQCDVVNSLTPPTATDNCGGSVIVTSNASFPITSDTTVTWTYDDGNGNTTTQDQNINLIPDTTDPTASNPAAVNVQCAGDVPAVDITDVTDEADNCSLEANITVAHVSDVSDGNSNPEVITRTYSVTDEASNSINVTHTITVNDTVDPVCLAKDITIDLAGSSATITGSDIDNGSTDNCSISTLVATPNFFDATNIGDNTVTLTVTDVNGNSSNCDVTVTVEDSTLDSQDFDENNFVNIYPNPFSDKLNVKLPQTYLGTTIKIEILDIRGRLIKTLNKEYTSSIVIKEFGDFEDGSYFIKITNKSNKIIFKQLIKD